MRFREFILLGAVSSLASCVSFETPEELFEPLERESVREAPESALLLEGEAIATRGGAGDLPKPNVKQASLMGSEDPVEKLLPDQNIVANYRDMPLPDFLNEVLGEQLGLSYIVEPGISEVKDLVTLSIAEPLPAVEFYRTLRRVLAQYGVSIDQEDNIINVRADRAASGAEVPILVSGSALPDVPSSHRPVFAIVPLRVVRPQTVVAVLEQLYEGTDLEIQNEAERNSLILKGDTSVVEAAIEAMKLLDQPLLISRYSKSYVPTFLSPQELAGTLLRVLQTEGYSATLSPPFGAIIILPFEKQQRLLIFANNEEVLSHAMTWAEELDNDFQDQVSDAFFTYQAKDVTADHIASLLSSLQGDTEDRESNNNRSTIPVSGDSGSGSSSPVTSYLGGKLVVDGNRNVLFFKGSGQEWGKLRKLIDQIDKPVPMVLIDVLLAEIRLSDGEQTGVEWLFRDGGPLGTQVVGSNLGGLSLGGSGLSLTFDSAGETRALVNAFYNSDRAQIRSSPKLLVKSGTTGSIEVGNEIPILTSNRQSTDSPGAPVIQNITYRKTGVLLTINPLVQASGLVDLIISQELSEQQATGIIGSPTILTRKIDTSLALSDGGSVLLGGLISNSRSDGELGVPPVGRIPLIGKLFRVETRAQDRTELIMLVSTYVVRNHDEANEITEILKNRMSGLE